MKGYENTNNAMGKYLKILAYTTYNIYENFTSLPDGEFGLL